MARTSYNPADPAVTPANKTLASNPPIVTEMSPVTANAGESGAGELGDGEQEILDRVARKPRRQCRPRHTATEEREFALTRHDGTSAFGCPGARLAAKGSEQRPELL